MSTADKTLMERVQAGEIPSEVGEVARGEKIDEAALARLIADGLAIIPRSNVRPGTKPVGIGKGLSVKVNANIGTSADYASPEEELAKLETAVEAGTDTVMDLSTGGDIGAIRHRLIDACHVPFGTVPIYQAAVEARDKRGSILEMTPEDMFGAVESHARDGVDFITVHTGVNLAALEALQSEPRLAGVVSRGGAFLLGWMVHHGRENPFFEDYDRLLEIARRYEMTLSLGDGMRPGAIADAGDAAQLTELRTLGDLVLRAREAHVQVMVEGPGHVPLNEVEAQIRMAKDICHGAPLYILGPLVTDIGAGHDHITGAIGGALAAYLGADFLCYVTPREHLGLPTRDDVREGVIAFRLAAHAADVARGAPDALERDRQMSAARQRLDWATQMDLALDGQAARREFEERQKSAGADNPCTMCGELCAMKLVSEYLGQDIAAEECGAHQ